MESALTHTCACVLANGATAPGSFEYYLAEHSVITFGVSETKSCN